MICCSGRSTQWLLSLFPDDDAFEKLLFHDPLENKQQCQVSALDSSIQGQLLPALRVSDLTDTFQDSTLKEASEVSEHFIHANGHTTTTVTPSPHHYTSICLSVCRSSCVCLLTLVLLSTAAGDDTAMPQFSGYYLPVLQFHQQKWSG